MNAQNNKKLIEIYKKTVNNIEKESKRIKFFNKIRFKKVAHCKQEVLALESGQNVNLQKEDNLDAKYSNKVHSFYNGDLYIGKLVDGKMEGKGTYVFSQEDGTELEYVGYFKEDMKHGNGVCELPNNCIYIGQWKDDVMDGIGKMIYSSEDEYLGNWKNGKKEGHGVYTWKNSGKYIGEFKHGKMDGIGICYDDNEFIIYEGEFKNNLPHGQGTYIWPDNKKYVGEFKHGKKHGFGTFYVNDEISFQGNWKFDKPIIFNKSLDEIISSIKID